MAGKNSKNTIGNYTRGKLEKIITEISGDQTQTTLSASNGLAVTGSAKFTGEVEVAGVLNAEGITTVATLTASNGICVTGSARFKDETEFAGDVTIAGTLTGGSPLKIANSLEVWDVANGNGVVARLGNNGDPNKFTGYVGFNVSNDADITHGITLPNSSTANSGSIKAYSYETYSSSRFKTNIKTIDNAIGKIKDMRGVYFDWKDSNKKDIGFIAEEVGDVIPEAVVYEDNGVDASSMSYQKLVSLLLQSVKEQQDIIENQNDRISQLEQKIDEALKK